MALVVVYDQFKLDVCRLNASNRLVKQVENNCMNCMVNTLLAFDNDNDNKFYKLPIIGQEGDNTIANCEHLLCNKCVYAVRNDIYQTHKQKPIPPIIQVKCVYCIKAHQVELKALKILFRSESTCCNIL